MVVVERSPDGQLGGRAVGARDARRHARRALDGGERSRSRGLRPAGRLVGRRHAPGRRRSRRIATRRCRSTGSRRCFRRRTAALGLVWLDGRTTHGDEGDMQLRAAMFDKSAQAAVRHDDRLARLRMLPDERGAHRRRSRLPRTGTAAPAKSATSTSRASRPAGGRCPCPSTATTSRSRVVPINGPPIAARGKDVVVAWFTAPNEMNRSYLAFSHDGGQTFGAPVRVDDEESLGRMAWRWRRTDRRSSAGWSSRTRRRQFKIRRVEPNGTRRPAVVGGEPVRHALSAHGARARRSGARVDREREGVVAREDRAAPSVRSD